MERKEGDPKKKKSVTVIRASANKKGSNMKIMACMTVVLALCVGQASAEDPADKPVQQKPRIGTYDSRVVAMAYCFSPACEAAEGKTVAACNTELAKAKATGDKKQVAAVEAKYSDLIKAQIRRHKQVFSIAPIDDVLVHIKDQMPDIAKAAGVSLIISKWDKKALDQYAGAEVVDVTEAMAKALHAPDENLKAALELRRKAPIPLEQAEKMDWSKE